jgi:hypothetical protein
MDERTLSKSVDAASLTKWRLHSFSYHAGAGQTIVIFEAVSDDGQRVVENRVAFKGDVIEIAIAGQPDVRRIDAATAAGALAFMDGFGSTLMDWLQTANLQPGGDAQAVTP